MDKIKINFNKKSNGSKTMKNKIKIKSHFLKKKFKAYIILILLFISLIPKEYKIKFKKNKVYCLLFNTANVHLLKELGLLPWGMHKYLGYDSFIATYRNDDYENLKLLPGLRLEFIPKIYLDFERDALQWLRVNSKQIDILNVIHFKRISEGFIKLFKKLNPSGKIYLKLDGVYNPKIFEDNLYIDFISIEFQEYTKNLSQLFHRPVGFVPNPLNPDEVKEFNKFHNRKNTIIYVGRIEHDKGSHTLIEAFIKIHDKIPNWKLQLTGRISNNLNITKNFFSVYPDLKDKVIFTGNINNRTKLIEMYRNSKIFSFPSRHEGCPFALSEAMSQGCFSIVSNIPPNKLLTNNFKYVYYHEVDNSNELADKLLFACIHEEEIEKLAIKGRKAIIERCDLEKCCKTIQEGVFPNSLSIEK